VSGALDIAKLSQAWSADRATAQTVNGSAG